MANKEILAVESVNTHLLVLRIFGFYPLDDRNTSYFFVRLHEAYSVFAAIYCAIYVALEIWYVVENWGDVLETVSVSSLLLTHIVAACKEYVLRFQARRIDAVIDMLKGPIFNEGLPPHVEIIQNLITASKVILLCYTSCAFATCSLWVVFPFMEGHEKELPLRSTFPFSTKTTPGYEIAFFIQIFVVVNQAMVITTSDHMIATLLYNACAQIKILNYNIEHINELAMDRIKGRVDDVDIVDLEHMDPKTRKFFNEAVEALFVKSIEHHKIVMEFVNEIERLFNLAVLLQFGCSGTIICSIAYRMTYVPPASIEFVSMILFMACMLAQILMFCYFGNELHIQSGAISEAIYRSEWQTSDLKLRKHMIIFMERSKRQIMVTAGKLMNLSLSTFVGIVKFSYTCFAVLHGAKSE